MIMARPNPSTRSSCPPAPAKPAAAGRTATARSPAIRATALLIAEAIPACSSSMAPSTAAVRGATVIANPAPSTSTAGRTVVQYVVPTSTRARRATPAPATMGPIVMGRRGPIRWESAPIRAENRSMNRVIGSSDAPASSAE